MKEIRLASTPDAEYDDSSSTGKRKRKTPASTTNIAPENAALFQHQSDSNEYAKAKVAEPVDELTDTEKSVFERFRDKIKPFTINEEFNSSEYMKQVGIYGEKVLAWLMDHLTGLDHRRKKRIYPRL